MGLFSRKISLKDAVKRILEFKKTNKDQDDVLFLVGREEKDQYVLKQGIVSAELTSVTKMLFMAAQGNERFSKALITASESLKSNYPDKRKFSDYLTKGGPNPDDMVVGGKVASDMYDEIKKRFPDSKVMSVDLSQVENMSEEDLKKMVDRIYRASQRGINGGEQD